MKTELDFSQKVPLDRRDQVQTDLGNIQCDFREVLPALNPPCTRMITNPEKWAKYTLPRIFPMCMWPRGAQKRTETASGGA